MKHHFGDFLDREGDYWTVVPNRERFSYYLGDLPAGSIEVTIATIGKDDENWERIFTYPNLEEVTLHEPSKIQIEAISKLSKIKRLRITHARTKTIEFISNMENIEELVFEYVSGFSDLSPLKNLLKLKSLHLENLRKVTDFSGLKGINTLRYIRIDGTLDWKQPILDFEFLKELPNLEVLSLGEVINKTAYPALLSILTLKKLSKINIPDCMFDVKEYALLTVGLKNVDGGSWQAYTPVSYYCPDLLPKDDPRYLLPEDILLAKHPEISISPTGERLIDSKWFVFLGKKAGKVKFGSKDYDEKCDKYEELFNSMKAEAKALLNKM